MIVVALFFTVVGVGMVTWYVVQKRRATHSPNPPLGGVSHSWLEADRYKRSGDVPPGTSRQEERK